MDEEKKNQEEQKTDEEIIKSFEKQIEDAESPEELMDIINKINESLPNGKLEVAPKPKRKRRWLIMLFVEAILSFGIMLGTTGLLEPFTLKMAYGDIYFIASIVVMQIIISLILRATGNGYIILFNETIKDILMFIVILGLGYVLPFAEFISEYDQCCFAVIFLISKSAILAFINKIYPYRKGVL